MDDQDTERPSRRTLFRELFRRREKSSAPKSDEGPAAPPTEGERIPTDLWGAAYEQIQKEDPKLLVAYKKYLLASNQGMSSNNTFYPAYPCLENK